MTASIWHRVAGLSGASAVALAAHGAHGFNPEDESMRKVFDNGNQFHLIHSAVIAAVPQMKRPNLHGAMFTVGTALFSGSCYATALTEDRRTSYLGSVPLAPIGGTTLILAWAALALLP
ncbi:hypothetical protein CYMTET_18735 [Cymbomonas tetramitiformis]|uniref:Uncharacterized protein n=1 Tax=Cymbomonas tetramitiformis TaxID=36881 RepID=A0AAE0G7G5_9CHLO|nr:hypothetical protein CYMTET_18735 [Cymbomonas tetramitiformis]